MKKLRESQIFVDADACPVKQEIVRAADSFGMDVIMVATHDHQLNVKEDHVQAVYVDRSDQSVDLYIANHLQQGDILVTQDLGLAALGLAKHAVALSVRGEIYTEAAIGFLLERRHANAKRRRGGGRHKGPKALSADDRENFLQTLTTILRKMQESRFN